MSRKNGQIGIFLIIAVISLILISTLVLRNSNENSKDIEEALSSISNPNDYSLFFKERVETCLENQVRKGLIVLGLKGGVIYTNDELYTYAKIPDSYSRNYLSSLDLNLNVLEEVLVSSRELTKLVHLTNPTAYSNVSYPKEDGSVGYANFYDFSIKEQLDKYLIEEFSANCLDFTEFENLGFEFEIADYVGELGDSYNLTFQQNFNDFTGLDKFFIYDINANDGDRLNLRIGSNSYLGTYQNSDLGSIIYLDEPLVSLSEIDRSEARIYNINDLFNISTLFISDNYDSSKSNTKVLLNLGFDFSYNSKKIEVSNFLIEMPINFESLYKRVEQFVNSYTDLSRVGRSSIFNETYFKDVFLFDEDNISLIIQVVNDSPEYKNYVFSFLDNTNKIANQPYIIRVGYENHGPDIFLENEIGTSSELSDGVQELPNGGFFAYVSANNTVIINLAASDREIWDNYGLSYFIEDSYDGFDAKYDISSKGVITFNAYINKRFVIPISATDGDAITTRNLVIIAGFPDNTNNKMASSCIEFENFGTYDFPINPEFKNTFEAKNSIDYNDYFGYSLFSNLDLSLNVYFNPKIRFNPTCLVNTDLYNAYLKFENHDGSLKLNYGNIDYTNDYGFVNYPISNNGYPIIANFTIIEKATGNVMSEPFIFTNLYSTCLGPEPLSNTSFYGGDRSCCSTGNLNLIHQGILNGLPQDLSSIRNSLINTLEINGHSQSQDYYFCSDIYHIHENSNGHGDLVNKYSNSNVWDSNNINSKPTSLFRGEVKRVCDGNSARGSISNIGNGNDLVGSSILYGKQINVNLNAQEIANSCQFCNLNYIDHDYDFEVDGIKYFGGPVNLNPDANVNSLDENLKIMCDERWYGKNGDGQWVLIEDNIGFGSSSPTTTYASQKFCDIGNSNCDRYLNQKSTSDNLYSCNDRYISNTGSIFSQITNQNWRDCDISNSSYYCHSQVNESGNYCYFS